MNALHEAVEVHPFLFIEAQRFKKRVHQVGLTPTHATPQVKPLLWCASRTIQQTIKKSGLNLGSILETHVQILQRFNRYSLRFIWHNGT